MFPHERSLVARLKDEPFALVGVNSDADLAAMKPKFKEEQITWRSFWNGPEATGGPISKEWEIQGWPTLYLIDPEGKICKKWVGSPGDELLDAAIDAALAKAKAKAGKAPAKAPSKKSGG